MENFIRCLLVILVISSGLLLLQTYEKEDKLTVEERVRNNLLEKCLSLEEDTNLCLLLKGKI